MRLLRVRRHSPPRSQAAHLWEHRAVRRVLRQALPQQELRLPIPVASRLYRQVDRRAVCRVLRRVLPRRELRLKNHLTALQERRQRGILRDGRLRHRRWLQHRCPVDSLLAVRRNMKSLS